MDYKKICKSLIAEIRRLRAENETLDETLQEMLEYNDVAIARTREFYERQYWEERRNHEREENERFWREYERQQLFNKLQHARKWGNSWEEERILRELRYT